MSLRNLPGPALLALVILAWAVILWVFTLGYPGFVPVARFIFWVLVVPAALAEWLRMKGFIRGRMVTLARLGFIILAALLWLVRI
ncbi:hypothetical protein GFC01_15860 [Desulfofundulus thermobenzoicus]|uniref:Uncharacterized protein n=1 Tax=Desulfofundulus thermobenzoicus TaxID=29376 RepID=A0A6N7IX21_9FIRM|nr:hypothetical protein [Desulfofundulus thermobenzoicus]MQL53708.1 hypothetical protein [Desulfofundulus thermobenzoicus]HHW42924.1 hypothetical protein [Desulfotomaculum sp.]